MNFPATSKETKAVSEGSVVGDEVREVGVEVRNSPGMESCKAMPFKIWPVENQCQSTNSLLWV